MVAAGIAVVIVVAVANVGEGVLDLFNRIHF
jgi:Flp pilus assembly pilin Flp